MFYSGTPVLGALPISCPGKSSDINMNQENPVVALIDFVLFCKIAYNISNEISNDCVNECKRLMPFCIRSTEQVCLERVSELKWSGTISSSATAQ